MNLLFKQIIRYFAVVMKYPFYISLLLCCCIWSVACTGPVIIEEEENSNTEAGKEDTTPTWEPVPIVHEGTYASPYSISEAQTLGRGENVWIEGYIVGSVSNNSLKKGCNFTADATTSSNILLADTFLTGGEYDYLFCMPVQLLNGSIEREDLNLYVNPDNYHRKLRIEGDITLYINNKPGIKEITDYIFADEAFEEPDEEEPDEDEDENENPEVPDTPQDPDKTNTDTLSIAEGIKLQNKGEQSYIKGYIIGYYNGSSFCLYPTEEQISTRASNNVVLADSIGEANTKRIIIVEFPTNTALRSKVNLKDNPQNLYHTLTVKGMLMDYKDTFYPGCMNTLSALRDDEDYYFSLE